ncbi:unnamed protein product [Acanthosepion pharaonis]|uniref:Androglobin n=1 Tax=Acanthosepion pharaonis TaxID=158019 RepID=A0A812E102_ACAPH|nr:unnamed protein product [Sepia pharaonis]
MEGKRSNPTPPKKAASIQQGGDAKRTKSVLWPEFVDIDAEKWDASNKGKDLGKLKSPVSPHFDDPDGKIEMPPSMTVDSWKRPSEMSVNKNLVVVDLNCLNTFDLVTANEHLHDSEVMRHIISQIIALWENSTLPAPRQEVINDVSTSTVTYSHSWRPWEHIYALCKSGKGAHMPLYNPHGKYVVRLYFMGCWRKITIDDTLPYNNKGKLLLPTTTQPNELWPLLLVKGLIKIASLDYRNRGCSNEFHDFNVLHHLTGWHPEIVPIMSSNASKIWNLLTKTLPEWKYPNSLEAYDIKTKEDQEKAKMLESTLSLGMENIPKDAKEDKDLLLKQSSVEKTDSRMAASKDKVKTNKDVKDKDKKEKTEKERSKDKTPMDDERKGCKISTKDNEVVIFATYWAPCCPTKVSMLGEMASASERLRQIGLSYLHPHPVWLTQTRTLPLEPPLPEEVIPQWKLIRPRKKKTTPSDEPIVHEEDPPIQCLELASAFLSYKINPISIPSTITRPKSYLERGGGRSRPSTAHPIEETDESVDPETSDNEVFESSTDEKDHSTLLTMDDENQDIPKKLSESTLTRQKTLSKTETTVDQKRSNSDDSQEKIQDPSVADQTLFSENDDKTGQKKDEDTELSVVPEVTGPKKTWIDFEQFYTCFKVLYIYHKPTKYQHYSHVSDFKIQSACNQMEDKSIQYLFIDSLKSSEIVVSFSSLSCWHDAPVSVPKEVPTKTKECESTTSPNPCAASPPHEQAPIAPLVPGNLAAEPYSWKSLVIGCPVLKLRTTAIRAAVLTLPPGRHVLRFLMTSPLGYSVHLLSPTPFVFGDEETIMSLCTKESCRFVDNATQVILSLGKCIKYFSNKEEFQREWEKLKPLHCPYLNDKSISKVHHFEVFNEALYSALSKVASFKQDVIFALRVMTFDATSKNVGQQEQEQELSRSRPTTGSISGTGQECEKLERKYSTEEIPVEDHIAAVKLQKCWRGGFVRKIRNARKHGSEENLKVWDIMKKFWAQIELNIEEIGLDLFRTLFKIDPSLMPYFEFYKDEWNKIAYADYQGTYPEHPADSWCVIFREIFMVTEEMMVVPKLYIPLKTCFLRVVDNDTGKEIPRIFKHVSPAIYQKNKRGYTFMAEAHSLDQPIIPNKWRIRIIGSLSPLPAPLKNEVNSCFFVNEIKDYYIPSETSFFMNYTVKVTDDHLATIQLSTSKPDALFQLCILDHGSIIYHVEGKGHAVLPAVIFFKDPVDDEALSVSSSKESLAGKAKRIASPITEHNSLTGPTMQMQEESERKPHKYQIQASILRDSWPLIPADWQFVMSLKDNLRNELKVDYKEVSTSPNLRQDKAAFPPPKLKVGKGKPIKEIKENKEQLRPPSQQFESNRPHWILRVVSDSNNAEQLEVRRDTSRAEEIRQLKKAWEEAEPGRAAKAAQSRLKYLNTHLIQVDVENEMEETLADQTPTNTPPNVLVKEKVPLLDLTPYLKDDDLTVRYVDEDLLNERQKEKQNQIYEYQNKRQSAKEWMNNELKHLRFSKVQQLETCRQMQLEMDLARENFNRKREDYRRRAIEEEAASLAAAAAALAANKTEVEAKS